jgi:hypothetical protein
MEWDTSSRSRSRARGGMGLGMDWRPGSRSQSRSRPSQLHLQTTGIQGFEFDDATNNNGNVNTSANIEGGVAIPQSVRTNVQGAGGAGSGGSGRSLLTRSLQMFSESPPVYGGWTSIGRPAAPPQHVRMIGEVVQSPQEEQQLKTEQQEAQDEEDFGGFMSSSLPAYHLGFSFAQPPAATATTTTATTTAASPFSRHVRSVSLDHSLSGDGSAASELLGSHQRPHPPKVPESSLVCHSVNV